MLRRGLWPVCAGLTLFDMAASTSILLVINAFLHRSPHDFWISMIASAGIPALIAPPVTWLAMRLLIEAKKARRTAQSMAVIDALTGAFNRRHFFIAGEHRFAHARRLHEPASLLLLDVDDFKAGNDLHGHALGDRVLIAVAQRGTQPAPRSVWRLPHFHRPVHSASACRL